MKPAFRFLLLFIVLVQPFFGFGYTHQDTLRGSNGRGRDWWNVVKYDLTINIDTATKTISGTNAMTFKVIAPPRDSMQIDLQEGMELEMPHACVDCPQPFSNPFVREGNVYWITKPNQAYKVGGEYSIELNFQGKPRIAKNPPWDGGLIWTKDSLGKPWIAVACQGLGASVWWPCKDYQGDEPDRGMQFWVEESFERNPYKIISNGRFTDGDSIIQEDPVTGGIATKWVADIHFWHVQNPINTYDVTFYIGDYAHWHDTLRGEKGVLDLDFYPLKYNEAKARKQWSVVKEMLRCYEYWLGPYPFYEDGYKLVEAPYLGMEHQSAVAYGNQYKMGYLGRDRSGTGVGLSFDFIIIHESAHEWFGNSITAQDIADNWIHEGFATYVESLFAEWIKGKDAGTAYTMGEWKNIKNDRPLIGDYGVNNEGSSDIYDKGSAVVFMIRQMLNDDVKFRELLRGLNKDFYHKIVTTKEVEDYISRFVGKDLKPFFDQYLRSTIIPELHQKLIGKTLSFFWGNAVLDFDAPIAISQDGGKTFSNYSATTKISLNLSKKEQKQVRIKLLGLYTWAESEQ
ncbi:MAG: M1 family metallopeptidase [Chitinophagaceae bacterium]